MIPIVLTVLYSACLAASFWRYTATRAKHWAIATACSLVLLATAASAIGGAA